MSQRLTENKLVLIVRRTRLDELVARYNTAAQARFYIEHLGASFDDYQAEDATYKAAVATAQRALERLGRLHVVDRSFLPSYLFGPQDTVVVVGQDGLVANVLKYLDGQPVLGVNPDPERWEGVLLPFNVGQLPVVLPQVFAGQRPLRRVTMAQAALNTGQVLYGVNDLFIGPRTHTSARYTLHIGERSEYHSSSGIIVSTGLGSTGWLRSILAGAAGIAASLAEEPLKLDAQRTFPWDADYVYFSVREPWPSKRSSATITCGRIDAQMPLVLVSHMAESGVIFSDGIEADYLQFNSGTECRVTVADKVGQLVG